MSRFITVGKRLINVEQIREIGPEIRSEGRPGFNITFANGDKLFINEKEISREFFTLWGRV